MEDGRCKEIGGFFGENCAFYLLVSASAAVTDVGVGVGQVHGAAVADRVVLRSHGDDGGPGCGLADALCRLHHTLVMGPENGKYKVTKYEIFGYSYYRKSSSW